LLELGICIFVGSLLLGCLFLLLSRSMFKSPTLQRNNYRGAEVPTGAGIIFAPVFLVVWTTIFVLLQGLHIYAVQRQEMRNPLAHGMEMMLVLVLGMCLVGFFDDVAGDRSTRGFKGHFTEAFHGRFTTGFFKALVGLIVALAATSLVFPIMFFSWEMYGKWLLNAAIVVLTANLFNLFDLRPGRSLKLFFPLILLTIGLALRFEILRYCYVAPALPVIAVALVLLPGDLREKRMLGDAGSNILGAVVGVGLVMGLVMYSVWWRIGILVFLLFLNVLSEKFSFSRVIEGNKVLNWLDELGRRRMAPPEGK
jgi:UDP-GlcNAc:undecaprenyl-phosphate GlcNAc-1-phosphate transferase